MTLQLTYGSSEERMLDRDLARSDCRAENPRMPKDEYELRMDSWI